jgi:hypothetical protein
VCINTVIQEACFHVNKSEWKSHTDGAY